MILYSDLWSFELLVLLSPKKDYGYQHQKKVWHNPYRRRIHTCLVILTLTIKHILFVKSVKFKDFIPEIEYLNGIDGLNALNFIQYTV
jgi:hypothetical protein